jgi:hypothetical protein
MGPQTDAKASSKSDHLNLSYHRESKSCAEH